MRTTSRILGIIGSALAILFGGLSMLTALSRAPAPAAGFTSTTASAPPR